MPNFAPYFNCPSQGHSFTLTSCYGHFSTFARSVVSQPSAYPSLLNPDKVVLFRAVPEKLWLAPGLDGRYYSIQYPPSQTFGILVPSRHSRFFTCPDITLPWISCSKCTTHFIKLVGSLDYSLPPKKKPHSAASLGVCGISGTALTFVASACSQFADPWMIFSPQDATGYLLQCSISAKTKPKTHQTTIVDYSSWCGSHSYCRNAVKLTYCDEV